MTFVLFLIFAVIILGIMFLLSVIKGVGSLIFGRSGSSSSSRNTSSANDSNYNTEDSHAKKVFSKDEGEYVKYEEIKD